MPKLIPNSTKITVIGLGYVGLPLALAFSKKYKVVGFDINTSRVSELKDGQDSTNESQKNELLSSKILFTSSAEEILRESSDPAISRNRVLPGASYPCESQKIELGHCNSTTV